MARQVSYVFFGKWRGHGHAHESPSVMTMPLAILAVFAVALGVLGTPVWPWFTSFVESKPVVLDWAGFSEPGLFPLMALSSLLVFVGLGVGWWLYARRPLQALASVHKHGQEVSAAPADIVDMLESASPSLWGFLANRMYFDELYEATVLRWYAWLAWLADWLDRRVWGGLVAAVSNSFRGLGWLNKNLDSQGIDGIFDKGCEELVTGGGVLAWLQSDRAPSYLRMLTFGVLLLAGLALVVGAVTGQVRL